MPIVIRILPESQRGYRPLSPSPQLAMNPVEPTFGCRIVLLARLVHRFHAFLDRQQRQDLGLFEVAGLAGGQLDAVRALLIGSLEDSHSVVFAQAVVEGVQVPAHVLYQLPKNDAAVFWYPGERGFGFRSVGELDHVYRHSTSPTLVWMETTLRDEGGSAHPPNEVSL